LPSLLCFQFHRLNVQWRLYIECKLLCTHGSNDAYIKPHNIIYGVHVWQTKCIQMLKYPQTNGRFVINHISSTIMNSSDTFRFCDNYMGNCFVRELFHHYVPNSNAISGFFSTLYWKWQSSIRRFE
jgi:hypothetical protein